EPVRWRTRQREKCGDPSTKRHPPSLQLPIVVVNVKAANIVAGQFFVNRMAGGAASDTSCSRKNETTRRDADRRADVAGREFVSARRAIPAMLRSAPRGCRTPRPRL